MRSRNPVRTNVPVSFTAEARTTSGQPLTYTWFFFDPAGKQDGPPLDGVTVTRAFPLDGKYTVGFVVSDGFSKSTSAEKVSVTLSPNSGSNEPNVAAGMTVENPDGFLAIQIPGSLGGVVDFDIVDNAPAAQISGRTAAGLRGAGGLIIFV